MHRITLLLVVAVLGLGAATARADDAPPADDAPATLDQAFSDAFTTPAANLLPQFCRYHDEAVFYAASDWLRLAQKLAANAGDCSDYYVSVTPLAADKTKFRPNQAAQIRALGPRFHAMAEINLAGWSKYVAAGHTWYEAGVEARRRMAAAPVSFDVASGDIWALNEVDDAVRSDDPVATADLVQLVDGLATGDTGMQYVPGLVFVKTVDQVQTDTAAYKAELERWLADGAFWSALERPVRFLAQEVYGDPRAWAVPGTERNDRAGRLSDYAEHLARLAEAGPASVEPARQFLRRTYVPLLNAAWRWPSAFGWTMLDGDGMKRFVSAQAEANRLFAGQHPQLAPDGRVGFAWAPRNVTDPLPPADFTAQSSDLLDRLAAAIHDSYAEGGRSPVGACAPGSGEDWCGYDLPGAAFTDAWSIFGSWS